MFRLLVLASGALIAGCGETVTQHHIDDWRSLLGVLSPSRTADLGPPNHPCLRGRGTMLVGDVGGHGLDEIVALARSKRPAEPIEMIRASGSYAEAYTITRCEPEQGRGFTLLFRRERGSWVLKETTQWFE